MSFHRDDTMYNRNNLYFYDIYPKVLVEGKEATLHLINKGCRSNFTVGQEYTIEIQGYNNGSRNHYPNSCLYSEEKAVCDEKGGFTFTHTFEKEMEYSIFIKGEDEIYITVYCVAADLAGRYPFRGDLHMHTCCSDGRNTPETVCATYRQRGYDFFAITDHNRYYPSLRAIDFYKNFPMEFVIVPGEEVHMPNVKGVHANVHIVNFGGEYSVNALVEGPHTEEVGKDKKFRAIREDCPDVMTVAEYEEKMTELSKNYDTPADVDPVQVAVYDWIFGQIRNANGLGIFAHPTWITGHSFHVSDAINDYLVEHKMFDAFEVLGGERYYEHNGFQTNRYYTDKAAGNVYPIVGSTDSHGCFPINQGSLIASTLVFSPVAERTALIKSIKDLYSVAVDTISEEFRIVGDMRLVRYACFLLKNYFPYHDETCFEEGRLMEQYTVGTPEEKAEAEKTMAVMSGRMQKLREKYFDF